MNANSDVEQVRQIVEGAQLPSYVVDEEVVLDTDTSGDEAFWIWVIVDDAEVASDDFFEHSLSVERQIHTALKDSGEARWAFVRFRSQSEQNELRGRVAQ